MMIATRPKKIPQSPGVYFFKDAKGRILYIGKATNLKSRLGSYFGKQQKDPRINKMLQEAASVNWQETESEIEAFLTEAEMIKENQPAYNIALRDDKRYSYVVITDDAFPRIHTTHQIDQLIQESASQVFGPFVDSSALRATLKILRRIFPYCTCRRPHHNYCLNYHLGNCPGFCCLKNPTITDEQDQEYKENIKAIKELLAGNRRVLASQMEKDMKLAAFEGDFETSIGLRDKAEKLRNVFENARIIKEISKKTDVLAQMARALGLYGPPERIEGYDISNIQGEFAAGAMVVFADGNPDRNEYRKFKIKVSGEANDTLMLKEVLGRRLNHLEWQYPDLILIDGGKGQINAARLVLSARRLRIPVISLTKDERHLGKHIYSNAKKKPLPLKRLPEGVKNLILQIDGEAHRFAISYYRKIHRLVVAP